MKYCTKCKVGVNAQHQNCPLCGAYLEQTADEKYPKYAEHQEKFAHPVVTVKRKVNFLQHKFNSFRLFLHVFGYSVYF